MTADGSVDLSFLEPQWEKEATAVCRTLSPAMGDALARQLYRHPEKTRAFLDVARHPSLEKAHFWEKLEAAVSQQAQDYGGARRCLELVLQFSVYPPEPPQKQDLKIKLEQRHKAAEHLRKALTALADDHLVLGLTFPELMLNGQESTDIRTQTKAEDTRLLLHEATGDLEGALMRFGPSLGHLIADLADRLERNEPMRYDDCTEERLPVPQDRSTRGQLWFERVMEDVLREFTGQPRHEMVADLEGAVLGIETGAEEVKKRSENARKVGRSGRR